MSVINQMLKDLDERKRDQKTESDVNAPVSTKTTSKKTVIITVIIMLIVYGAGFFVWQLYEENKQLKNTGNIQSAAISEVSKSEASKSEVSKNENKTSIDKAIIKKASTGDVNRDNTKVEAEPQLAENKKTEISSSVNKEITQTQEKIAQSDDFEPATVINNPPQISSPTKEVFAPKVENVIADTKTIDPALQQNKKPTLTISRKQVSPAVLIKQKLSAAEQALSHNKILEAEQLFEDILLLDENHHSTRKQLAALWFGRKLYQPALNLLSQGLHLNPQDGDFRLMKARIYLNQDSVEMAYQTLQVTAQTQTIEYQSLLANLAQQLGKFTASIAAYKNLIEIQNSSGKWWLGLAVAYDSNGDFQQALPAYKEALARADLSGNTAKFTQQRIIELGD